MPKTQRPEDIGSLLSSILSRLHKLEWSRSSGGADGTKIPAATQTGYTINSTDYANDYGSGALAVAVFPEDTPAIAIAIEGDAYPRCVLMADGTNGIYLADGTVDPLNRGANLYARAQDSGSFSATLYGNGAELDVGDASDNFGKYIATHNPLTIQNATLHSGSGDPNSGVGAEGGNVGDIYIDVAGSPLASSGNGVLWQCTTAGVSSTAVWIALV